MIEIQYLIGIFTLILIFFIFKRKKPTNFPPGPLSLPLIGNLHQLGMEPQKTFMKMSKTYGNIFAIDFGGYSAVVLNDLNSIKEALNNDAFTGRPKFRPFVERCGKISRGIIFSDGKVWEEQRKFILKTLRDFGFGKKSMEGLIQQEIQESIEQFQINVGKPISIRNKFNGPLLNSLWNIMTGERFEYNDPTFQEALYLLTEATGQSSWKGAVFFFPMLSKLFPEWSGYNQIMTIMNFGKELIDGIIKQHKESFHDNALRDFTDVYLNEIMNNNDTQSSFYEKEGEQNLKIVLADFTLAAVSTTEVGLVWAFSLLAQRNKEQEKLYNEIKSVIGLSRQPSLIDKEKMPYTEALIMEVLRFSAFAPLGILHATTQDINFQGYFIPKDTLIIPNLYAVLKDVKTWKDPDNFRPERFLLPNGQLNRNCDANIPFSLGRRICPGDSFAKDEMFLFVTMFFQKFQVSNDTSQPIPSLNDCKPGTSLSPLPHNLIFQER